LNRATILSKLCKKCGCEVEPALGPFGTFGPWVGHGFGGGSWHGLFGPWGFPWVWERLGQQLR